MHALLRKNLIWIAALLAAALLAACGQTPQTPAPSASPASAPPTSAAVAPTMPPVPTATAAPTAAMTQEPTDTPASGSDLPSTPAPKPPAPQPHVDDSFFADAAFFGNSLMDGLRLFGGLKHGDFYSGTSASVVSVSSVKDFRDSAGEPSTMLHALLEKQYGKIFVLFGINELGFHVGGFIDIYTELLEEIAAGEPDAQIFILSLTPITEKRSEESDLFTKERVLEFNEAIADMAERCGCVYMDLYGALADENGWLPEKDASDGIHFTGAKYGEWADFLRSYPYVFDSLTE